ncbi:MAG: ribosome maturation factor RimM [Betaproteobacteria bacterium]|nr:ribosome maturation factor RimM [Betaproteobacteria bacterium]
MLVMGQVLSAYGVQGWVRLRTFTEDSESLLGREIWWLAPPDTPEDSLSAWRPCAVLTARTQGHGLVAELEGVTDREAAARMRGTLVAVPRESLPKSGEDEFYWVDLIGLTVLNRKGEGLGHVAGLIETGAHDVLRVTGVDGRERLIPFVAAFVDGVDLAERRVTVDWELDY